MKKIINNKNKLFLIGISLFYTLSFSSCDKYLSEAPDNRQELTSLEDLKELLVSSYSEGAYNYIEWKTDNVVAIKGNSQATWLTENFSWQEITAYESQDSPSYLWSNGYNAIAHSNQVLSQLDGIKDDNIKLRNAIKGEALITRAYNYFILANVFCQAYNKATASIELGLPYIEEPETKLIVNYTRGTLEELYSRIENDLLQAIPLISDEFYGGTGKYHFNKNAAFAFASRFFLFKQDYDRCIEYSNKLLGDGIISDTFVRDMISSFRGNTSAEVANKFINPKEPSNLLLVRKETLSAITRYSRGYQPIKDIFGIIYGQNVQRSKDARDYFYSYGTGAANPPKYTELFRYTTNNTGFPYFIMPELRSEETILNRIEAYIQKEEYNKALDDYNAFAPTRYLRGGQLDLSTIKEYYGGTDKEAMMQFIINERRKEFLREGIRWWDIKRFNISIVHKDVQGNEYILAEKDLRKAEQIPAKAISQGIERNPR